MRKLTYFTFGESINGVYKSQVIDTVIKLRERGEDVKLVAMVSPSQFKSFRNYVKYNLPNSYVIPYVFKFKYFETNRLLLVFFNFLFNSDIVICRGILATKLALKSFKKKAIVYDGRGAIAAEQNEFNVYKDTGLEDKIHLIEKDVILNSNYRIAISNKLVDYWRSEYGYKGEEHQIIPCLTSQKNISNKADDLPINFTNFFRTNNSKIKLVFSGGSGKWQNIEEVVELCYRILNNQADVSVIFLSPETESIKNLSEQFPERVICSFVKIHEVERILSMCDYGILLRQNLITNKVASPVKVAEYLLSGLKVIISDNVGDYSEIISMNDLGIIYRGQDLKVLPVSSAEKQNIQNFALSNFTKENYKHKFYEFGNNL